MLVTEEQEYTLDLYHDDFITTKTAILKLLNLGMTTQDICEGMDITEDEYTSVLKGEPR